MMIIASSPEHEKENGPRRDLHGPSRHCARLLLCARTHDTARFSGRVIKVGRIKARVAHDRIIACAGGFAQEVSLMAGGGGGGGVGGGPWWGGRGGGPLLTANRPRPAI